MSITNVISIPELARNTRSSTLYLNLDLIWSDNSGALVILMKEVQGLHFREKRLQCVRSRGNKG